MSAIACLASGVAKVAVAIPVATVAAVALKGVIVLGGVACGILLVAAAVKLARHGTAEECLKAGGALFAGLRDAAIGS